MFIFYFKNDLLLLQIIIVK